MFKTIMVPTDGSQYALKAEEIAISIAKKFNAKLVLVYVIDQKLIQPFDVLEDEGNAILDNAALKGIEQGLQEVDKVLIVGNPAQDMAKIVEKTGADLVVIATHGKTGLEKLLMGSVAEKTLKSVKAPVLLVK